MSAHTQREARTQKPQRPRNHASLIPELSPAEHPNSEEAQVGPLPYYERPPLARFPMRDQSATIATVSSKTPARGNG